MLRQQARLLRNIAIASDQAGLLVAFVAAYLTRRGWGGFEVFNDRLWVLLLLLPCWHLLYWQSGTYTSLRTISFWSLLGKLLKVHCFGGFIFAALLYLTKYQDFNRSILLLFLLYSFVISLSLRLVIALVLRTMRRRGRNIRYLVVVGTGKQAVQFLTLLREHQEWGLHVVGLVHVPGEPEQQVDVTGVPIVGTLEQLIELCKRQPVDEVVFCVPRQVAIDIEPFLSGLDELGITARMVLSAGGTFGQQREVSLFHGAIPILTFNPYTFNPVQLFFKRCLDIVGSFVGLGITACFFPFVVLAIRLESPGPFFFGQERVGQNGRIFRCWKFRSMFIDAEERKQALMTQNEMKGAMFKMKDDPRVTRVGRFIRKTSIDELPQFWNVLMGDMSLVGTRPPTPAEVATYENWHRKRICIKPGITGLWQVSGRNQITDFDEVVRLDIQYIENWNIGVDIRIIFKTIWVVLTGSGAR